MVVRPSVQGDRRRVITAGPRIHGPMGRRSRKRATTPVAPRATGPVGAPAPRPAPRAATYKARRDEAPQPAWAPLPLTELCILLAIVLLGVGFFVAGGD